LCFPTSESFTPSTTPNHDWKNRMRESRSYGSVGEPVSNYRLYPEEAGGEIPPPTRFGHLIARRIWHPSKTPRNRNSGSGKLRLVFLHTVAFAFSSRTTFSVGLDASQRQEQLRKSNPTQTPGPSRPCILDSSFAHWSLLPTILHPNRRPLQLSSAFGAPSAKRRTLLLRHGAAKASTMEQNRNRAVA
jgi:hypothetical protein